MKEYIIIDGIGYKIAKNKAYEINWDFETGNMEISKKPSDVEILGNKLTYGELYKKLNVRYNIQQSGVDKIATKDVQLEKEIIIEPKSEAQIIKPRFGYDGLADVTVEAVTAAIDENIVAGNIKKGVTILGVEGTYEGETPSNTPAE